MNQLCSLFMKMSIESEWKCVETSARSGRYGKVKY